MIKFLFKGLLRDRSRSLLPIIVVALGVMITVFMHAYLNGAMGESIEKSAAFNTGHLRVETRGYAENRSQMPLDMALWDADSLKQTLQQQYPSVRWVERIHFCGLIDVPDSAGNTRAQGNVAGIGFDMLGSLQEIDRMELRPLLVKGNFLQKSGEIMVSDELFNKMNLSLGEKVTLISSTMYGEMAMYNFTVSGTLHFGVTVLDRGMVLADLHDIQTALNMDNTAGELLGFFDNGLYNNRKAGRIVADFQQKHAAETGEFSLVMSRLSETDLMGMSYDVVMNLANLITLIFLAAMSIVLWNTGLISGLRRYGEFGLRLAIGESKREIYRSLLWEAVLVGLVGTIIGTVLGLLVAWFMQVHGLNMENISQGSSLMISNVIRAKITPVTFFIGFFPGLVSTVIGAMLAGIGVYKRQTANLFKELEN